MPKPDWDAFKKLKRVTPENIKPYAQERVQWFNMPKGAVIEPGVLCQITGYGKPKTIKLVIQGSKLTRKHFEELASIPLRFLSINGCSFRDADSAALRNIKTLDVIHAEGTGVGDKTCEALATCKKLSSIKLKVTKVGNKGAAALSKLENIYSIDLSNTRVTDKGAESLGSLKRIQYLRLNKTKLTRKGLAALVGLKRCDIEFAGTGITRKDYEAVQLSQRESNTSKTKTVKKAAKKKTTKKKATTASKANTDDKLSSEVEAATNVLRLFCEGMTRWEINMTTAKFESGEYYNDVRMLFMNYCVPKKRFQRIEHGTVIRTPPTYQGFKRMKVVDVEAIGKRKLVLTTRWPNRALIKFVMLKKGEQWRIDQKKVGVNWDNDYL